MLNIVYKYFNWDDALAKRILANRELYFCNAKRWKNYGEYNFCFKEIEKQKLFELIKEEVYNMRNFEFNTFEMWFKWHIHFYKIEVIDPTGLGEIERLLWEAALVDEIIKQRVLDISNNPKIYENIVKQNYFKRTGIFSTSLISDSKQLWKWKNSFEQNYTGNAICIGLNLDKIKCSLDTIGNYSIGKVNYTDNPNSIDLIGIGNSFLIDRLNSVSFTLEKNAVKDLEEQQEVRIMKFLKNDISKKSKERLMYIENEVVTEIIINSKASTNTTKEVKEIADKLEIKTSVYPEESN